MKSKLSAKPDLHSRSVKLRVPNLRMFAGIILITASFISAYLISHSSNRMITVWSAVSDLAPGRIIEATDVKPIQVQLPLNATSYLSSDYPIAGSQILRSVGASELIPAYSLSTDVQIDVKRVPIALSRSRIPLGLSSGSLIDLYAIPRNQFNTTMESSNPMESQLLISGVSVDGIDGEASKLGGDIGLTILVSSSEVLKIILSMANNDFVVVRSN